MQSPIERAIDKSKSSLRIISISISVLVVISATFQREQILKSHNEFVNFNSTISSEFEVQTKILKDISSKISKASIKLLPKEITDSKKINEEIEILIDSLKLSNNRLLDLVTMQKLNIPDSLSEKYVDNMVQCDRIIDKYISYQLNDLTKDKSYLGFESWLKNRKMTTKNLINYNSLFTKNILSLDESFIQIKLVINDRNEKMSRKWKGII